MDRSRNRIETGSQPDRNRTNRLARGIPAEAENGEPKPDVSENRIFPFGLDTKYPTI